MMSMIAIYSSLDLTNKKPVIVFLITYVSMHAALCFIPSLSDDSYYGIALLPISLLDYIAFVYIVYFLYTVE
jgi:hypothetical protein